MGFFSFLDTNRYDAAFAGALSGMFAVTVSYPFDLLKTRMQFAVEHQSEAMRAAKAAGEVPVASVKPSLPSIGKLIYTEGAAKYGPPGGVISFYRGLDQLLPEAAFKVMFRFVCYTAIKEQYKVHVMGMEKGSKGELTVAGNLLCGSIAGFCEAALVVQPFERGKTLRADFSSPYQVWGRALKTRGPVAMLKSIYTGFPPCAGRQIGNQAMGFTVFYGLKERYLARLQRQAEQQPGSEPARTDLNTLERLSFGFLGGCMGALITMPLDVAKTIAQKQKGDGPTRSMVTIIGDVARSKGVLGLYTGLSPRLFRVGLDRAAGFVAFEYITGKLRERRAKLDELDS